MYVFCVRNLSESSMRPLVLLGNSQLMGTTGSLCSPSSVLCSLGQRECNQCGEGYWSNAQKSECVLRKWNPLLIMKPWDSRLSFSPSLGYLWSWQSQLCMWYTDILRWWWLMTRSWGFLFRFLLSSCCCLPCSSLASPTAGLAWPVRSLWHWGFLSACLAFLVRLFHCFQPTEFPNPKLDLYPSTLFIGKTLC